MVKLHLEDGVEKMHISKYFVIIKPHVTQMLHKYYFIVFMAIVMSTFIVYSQFSYLLQVKKKGMELMQKNVVNIILKR